MNTKFAMPTGGFLNICSSKYEAIEFMVCTVTKGTENSHPENKCGVKYESYIIVDLYLFVSGLCSAVVLSKGINISSIQYLNGC